MTVRQEMIQEIKSINRFLTDEVLEQKTDVELYNNTHPLYRETYYKRVFNN